MAARDAGSVLDLTRPRLRDRAWWLGYRAAYFGMRLWWRLHPAAHRGALVALHVDGKLLLIRNSYRRGWTLPGGGVDAGETTPQAAMRELREELGLDVAIEGTPTVIRGFWEVRSDTVDIFDLHLPARPDLRLDYREVVEARFVDPGELGSMVLTGPAAAYAALRWPIPAQDEHPRP